MGIRFCARTCHAQSLTIGTDNHRRDGGSDTYVSVVVELIVRQLELVEGDGLLHPVRPTRRTIRVHVDPGRRHGIGATRHDPGAAVKRVSIPLIVARDEVHHHQILRTGVQAEQPALSRNQTEGARHFSTMM